jgi:hypothetical protein
MLPVSLHFTSFPSQWHGHVSMARALYRACLDLRPDERGCALHGAFAAPPMLRHERQVTAPIHPFPYPRPSPCLNPLSPMQAYALYLRVLADAHAVLATRYPDAPGPGVDDRDADPQLNVRELQLHYQVNKRGAW